MSRTKNDLIILRTFQADVFGFLSLDYLSHFVLLSCVFNCTCCDIDTWRWIIPHGRIQCEWDYQIIVLAYPTCCLSSPSTCSMHWILGWLLLLRLQRRKKTVDNIELTIMNSNKNISMPLPVLSSLDESKRIFIITYDCRKNHYQTTTMMKCMLPSKCTCIRNSNSNEHHASTNHFASIQIQ